MWLTCHEPQTTLQIKLQTGLSVDKKGELDMAVLHYVKSQPM